MEKDPCGCLDSSRYLCRYSYFIFSPQDISSVPKYRNGLNSLSLLPQTSSIPLPIQTPALNRLGDMLFMNGITAVKVGNGTSYLEDTGIGARRETEAVGDQLQHAVA